MKLKFSENSKKYIKIQKINKKNIYIIKKMSKSIKKYVYILKYLVIQYSKIYSF